jgi:hypothetical protein
MAATKLTSAARDDRALQLMIGGYGVTERLRDSLQAVVSSTLAVRADHDSLTVVLTRLLNGEWTVFITDGTNLELVDAELTARLGRVLKDTERRVTERVHPEDRRVLEAIGRAHGHGPRRPLALLDVAWAETGSEGSARAALQRLLLLGLVELVAAAAGRELLGRLTDKGADMIGYR